MERAKNKPLLKPGTNCALIILFHTVGLIGFLYPVWTPLFLKLVPFHLLLMMALLIAGQPDRRKAFWLFLTMAYLAGFFIELLGISTGTIFGDYQYGNTLGLKLLDVPLMIGINWSMLLYSVAAFVVMLQIRNRVQRALLGAVLLVLLDILIEPVAVKYNYWSWADMNIPFSNYVAWFLFSFVMLLFLFQFRFRRKNIAAAVLFIVQVLFFAALNIWAF
ncbi:carotenoid biosynthesis protein (plasmid) [Pedobacter sp. BS3]|uniref:carotenoid biosynthesis protein n=1 Tax=Pedobacter sp. BS3 TaxID=2567937 RepID=UPI0011ED0E53|nr:carotenoid biosynthesis protein [Pedobacter sp. BS3]TZF86085.1 carotenoid biosynthesis protein [Pedobacter sp. BS3]